MRRTVGWFKKNTFRKIILAGAFIVALAIIITSVSSVFSRRGETPRVAKKVASTSTTAATTTTIIKTASSGDGETVLQGKCTVCHDLERVKSAKKSETEWSATVDRMMSKGDQFTPEEKAELVAYLAATYGTGAAVQQAAATGTPSQPAEPANTGTVAASQTTTTAPAAAQPAADEPAQAGETEVAAASTPAEQAETGVEMLYYFLGGGFMFGSGVYLRRRPRN